MKTARLLGIDQNPGSQIVFADVEVSDGTWMFEIAFAYEGGKYQALWQLAQRLSDRGIEVIS